jgi:DNA repair protein RecO (recombination protein O)
VGVYHADALVIRSREYGESDRLLTLFSREHGKIQAVAKGVRKPKSRQRAGAQLFTYADYLLYRGKTLDTINQVSPKESFPHLWTDLDKSLAATAMAELLDLATIPGQPYPELFTLTFSSFFILEQYEPALVQSAYTLKLLAHLGHRPRFVECAECGKKVQGERLLFSPEAGGVVCRECQTQMQNLTQNPTQNLNQNYNQAPIIGRWVRGGSLALMRQLIQGDLTKLDRIRWNEWMKKEILDTLQFYCEQTFEKRLKSWSMGNRLVNVGQDQSGKGGQAYERSVVDGIGED